ncbi:hypothetical protein [Moorena producens]|uniref:hypothetical protein n=1 Tax=Moorena producens TaxID=1155739 RepID=UPI003C76D37C
MFPQWMPPTHVRTLIALRFPGTRKEQVEDNLIFKQATETYIQKGLNINLKKSGDTVYPTKN